MKKIVEYLNLFKNGEMSPVEILEQCLSRIDPEINAYITVTEDRARKNIKNNGALRGIPVAVKDNILIEGLPTTCASRILHGFVSPYSATVCNRLEREGALFIGKTNLDEFAMGSSTENSYYGLTRNPFDKERVPGGSSGGSAAAVANGSAVVALGSDTGGSVRQPAAFCGLVGLKPTYGRVSRYGLVAFASSLDQIGIIGRCAMDVGLVLKIIAGRDRFDSTSVDIKVDDYTELDISLKGVRIGIPDEYLHDISEETYENLMEVRGVLEREGVEIYSVSLPSTDYVVSTYQVISSAEASSNLARYDGVRYGPREVDEDFYMMIRKTRDDGFLNEVKRRILVGTFVLSSKAIAEYYERALRVRTIIKNEIENLFTKGGKKGVDYILSPTTPRPAFKIGERFDDPLKMHLSDRFTAAANLTGIPAISAPSGMNNINLPIGYQIMGRPFDEKGLLSIVNLIEKLRPFNGLEHDNE